MFLEKHGNLTITLFALFAIGFSALSVKAKYGGGTGEPNEPYLIYDLNHMQAIGADANDWDKCFKLMADIDLSAYKGEEFNIIGYRSFDPYEYYPFHGVFDGNGHTISNFTYVSNNRDYIGLFGFATYMIKNLGLIDPNVDAGTGFYVGSLVGEKGGTVTGCYVEGGRVSGNRYVGGLVGRNNSVITNCYTTCDVSGDEYIGGLVGNNPYGTIINCYSIGSVEDANYSGGLVGGDSIGRILASFWNIETSGQTTSTGGIAKTTAEMQTASTFVGWSCSPVWTIQEGVDYPRLIWEGRPGEPIPVYSYGGGSGEPNDPYLIYTAQQLNNIGSIVCDWDKHFKLMADIDLSYYDGQDGRPQFNMIADYPDYFVGIFDGNGHVIRNFTVSLTGLQRSVALFRNTRTGAVIKNLDMENTYVNVPGGNRIASIHGEGRADIINCKVSGTIIGDYLVGGLSGQNYGNTENCYSYCTIVGEGGGGLIGWNSGIVNQCCSKSIVSGLGDVGGLVGRNFGLITNSYSDSSVTSDSFGAGGLAGDNGDTILSCYALGKVSGDSWVGGLIGEGGFGLTENCYAIADVKGNTGVGGLIGLYLRATISNCYSSGSVSGTTDVGGLLGIEHEKPVIVTSCYFLDPNDGGGPDNGYGEPLTDAEMKQQASFIGWDFSTPVWKMNCEGMSYPKLDWWQPMPGDLVCPDGVNFFDYSFFASQWAEDNCGASNDCEGRDLDQLGSVDINDLRIFVDNWLKGF